MAATPSSLAEQCRAAPLVFDNIHPELCPALEQIILARMRQDRGRRTGSLNVGGWKSGEDFFAWSDAAVQTLHQAIAEVVSPRPLVAWAMVNRAGSQHPRHQHRVAILSGVYYVTAGDPRAPTIFECPCDERSPRGDVAPYELEVEPYPGRLALFRGTTWHRVAKYVGESPRITIAFDIRR